MSKQIQWFPGHMSKTLREFEDITKKIDLFFILVDARAPKSSYIDQFDNLINGKQVIVLLTKADLVLKTELKPWIQYYKNRFGFAFPVSLTNKKMIQQEILKITNQIKFRRLLPKFIILGVPNVGKSTLLNILTDNKRAKVEDRPGVTKTNSWYQFAKKYWIMDTPGVLQPSFEDDSQGLILAAIGSIKLTILPLHEVAEKLIIKLQEKGYDLGYDDVEKDLIVKLNNSNKSPEEFYKKIILNYQKGKYGKIILD